MLERDNQVAGRKVLVIEDDQEILDLLRPSLVLEGFAVDTATSGEAGLDLLRATTFDLVLLDVMLPGINGFETLRRIRAEFPTPVIMLTARGAEVDRIVGLEIGADDYIAKPFSFRELVARMQAVLRRSFPSLTPSAMPVPASPKGVHLDGRTRSVRCDGQLLELTAAEYEVLRLLMQAGGEPVTREVLCRKVFDREYSVLDRGIDNLISSVRRKLGPTPDGLERIKTIRNVGYVFTSPESTCAG
ncbi:MAG: response regulator transcription factor [Bryobacterales bacterium]|nr:response regulator transcription factor [Bryobacterales bacterium]